MRRLLLLPGLCLLAAACDHEPNMTWSEAMNEYCKGSAKAEIGGKDDMVINVEAGVATYGGHHGEFLTFITPSRRVMFLGLRQPGAGAAALKYSLSDPPPGWTFDLECEPAALCGSFTPSDRNLRGTVEFKLQQKNLAFLATLCLEFTPRRSSSEAPIRVWIENEPLMMTCTIGDDSSCNADPNAPSNRGACSAYGTCTCKPGYKVEMNTGKCK